MAHFIKVRNMLINLEHICSVKRTKRSRGADGIMREYVISLTEEAEPDIKYRKVWASKEEIAPLLKEIELDAPIEWEGKKEKEQEE